MTDHDAWRAHEHRTFGREPTTDDLLDRHLGRTGTRRATDLDPASYFQVHLLRHFLRVLHSALDDEHVDPEVSRRVIERVIYGGVPQPAAVEQMLRDRKAHMEALSLQPLRNRWQM